MIKRLHHFDGGPMRPFGFPVNNQHRLVAHVLAVELANDDVVLIDSGIGTVARQNPRHELGALFLGSFRPDLDTTTTVKHQLVAAGLAQRVKHIILTHLDVDHAGGLSDFPEATVHVHRRELAAMRGREGWNAPLRYRRAVLNHQPRFEDFDDGVEEWFGFAGARTLPGLPDDIVVIPLPGHSPGHIAVAIRTSESWMLHCGDAYYHEGAIRKASPRPPWGIRLFERIMARRQSLVTANQRRLRDLSAVEPSIVMFSAHDPNEFDRLVIPHTENLSS